MADDQSQAPSAPAPKRGRGRPSAFNPEAASKICAALSEGIFLSDAAALMGVDVRTVSKWIHWGETSTKEPYHSFARDVAHARAQFVLLTTREVREGKDADRGKRWLLEKLRPRQYGERVKVEIDNGVTELLSQLESRLPSDVYAQVLSAIAAGAGAGAAPSPSADPS